MKKSYVLVLLAVVALGAMFVMAIQNPLRFPVFNRMVAAVVSPVTGGATAVGDFVDGVGETMTTTATLRDENKKLREEIDELRFANIALAEIYAENARLREFMKYSQKHREQKLVVAEVIGYNLSDLRDTLFIDRGSEDGIKKDMAVITPRGLVGLIDEVYPSSSKVVLATSNRCKVGARVLRSSSRAVGVVHGGGMVNMPLIMEHLPREADILKGDIIVTSGYSESHPSGIVIGVVRGSEMDASGLLRTAEIVPATDSTGIEELMVVVYNGSEVGGQK